VKEANRSFFHLNICAFRKEGFARLKGMESNMNLIVAVTANWGIGCENDLLFKISEDQRHFRRITTGKVVVMGHNTLKSLPNGKPLKNRTNIVLSRDTALEIDGVMVCNSIPHLLETLKAHNPADVFVIGGGVIYTMLLPYCNKAYITKFQASPLADTYLPNIDEIPGWTLAEESEVKEFDGLKFTFCVYERVKPAI